MLIIELNIEDSLLSEINQAAGNLSMTRDEFIRVALLRAVRQRRQIAHERQDDDLLKRREVVQRIKEFREQMFAKYGEMPDSAELIREDRER